MFVGNDVLDNVSIQHYHGPTLSEGAINVLELGTSRQ